MMGVSRGYGPASTNEDCRSNGLALPHRWEYYPPTNSFMVTFFSTASLRPYTVSYLTPTPMIEFVSFRLYSHRPRCRSECREVGLRPGTKISRPSNSPVPILQRIEFGVPAVWMRFPSKFPSELSRANRERSRRRLQRGSARKFEP